jgi:hypothetical protein
MVEQVRAGRRAAGSSRTPLTAKLGIPSVISVLLVAPPDGYRQPLGDCPGVRFVPRGRGPFEVVQLLVTRRATLTGRLPGLRRRITPAGAIWVSWPKRAAKVATDVTEEVVRAVALPLGLVNVKVCAVDEVWSGLKLVIRVANRPRASP